MKSGKPGEVETKYARASDQNVMVRLDERGKFMLEFLVKRTGWTRVKIIEQALRHFADLEENRIADTNPDFEPDRTRSWRDYYDPDKGMQELIKLTLRGLDLDEKDEERATFVAAHEPFFYHEDWRGRRETSKEATKLDWGKVAKLPQWDLILNRDAIAVLWPTIDELVAEWRATRATDRDAVVRKMKTMLKSANVAAPQWAPTKRDTRK